ncbi:MAG TPA: hypothetical protein PK129_01755 [Cellvibrionaceae bacterium]|nr:hypothetical protein [Cellvibrionaceae bacterium]
MKDRLAQWLQSRTFTALEIDCVNTVMLKILDGKCKMAPAEKTLMTALYDALKTQPGKLLGLEIHLIIHRAQHQLDDAMRLHIYEQRLLAETMLSRPIMKAFKARLRNEGLFLLDEEAAALINLAAQ